MSENNYKTNVSKSKYDKSGLEHFPEMWGYFAQRFTENLAYVMLIYTKMMLIARLLYEIMVKQSTANESVSAWRRAL